ncbi:MAG: phosphatidylglycerophosphatase A [Acidimicrobiia bacterium]
MHRFVASGFFVGLLPSKLWRSDRGAGTFGAVLAALVAFTLWHQPWWIHASVFGLFFVLALWSSSPFAGDGADPGWIVIDEMAGTFVAVIGLSAMPWLVAVVVARLADIFKVLPGIAAAERLSGAAGITMDDVVAGCYGLAAGWFTWWVF